MRRFLTIFGVVTIVAALGLPARADTIDSISYSDSIPLSTTNWASSVSVPKFNPALGTLLSIDFTLTGYVQGSAKFESLDAQAATITMNLSASVKLHRPDLSVLAVSLPLVSTTDNATAYDGTFDFGGTSGHSYFGLSGSDTVTTSSPPPPSDLVLFTGLGNITLPVDATGASNGSGAGNLILQFATDASADVTVKYTYKVPEPGSLGLLSLAFLRMLRRRR